MRLHIACTNEKQNITDPRTDPRLLPPALRGLDNKNRMRHYRAALREAMETQLTPVQREHIQLHYWQGMRKSEIARLQKVTGSAVSKSIQAAQQAIREYVEMYMRIYDCLLYEMESDQM